MAVKSDLSQNNQAVPSIVHSGSIKEHSHILALCRIVLEAYGSQYSLSDDWAINGIQSIICFLFLCGKNQRDRLLASIKNVLLESILPARQQASVTGSIISNIHVFSNVCKGRIPVLI